MIELKMPSKRPYPPSLSIEPLTKPARGTVVVPGSKSITNRALVLAALAAGERPCTLEGVLRSEDTDVMIDSLHRLGFSISSDGDTIAVHRPACSRLIPASSAELFVGNSGTTMRFLTAFASLGGGRYRLDGVPRMRQRPIGDLLDALRQLGVNARSEHGNGCPPVIVESDGLRGGHAGLKGDVSSQFLSALLLVAPAALEDVVIDVEGPLVSEPYVQMTIAMLRQFGADIHDDGGRRFHVRPQDHWKTFAYVVEPDASAASYFFAAAAITGGTITVLGLSRQSLQGDVRFVEFLEQMGCRVEECESGITVHGRSLHGIDVDMNAISDTVMTLGAVACFAAGPTTIRNVAHIRHKETDRISALATELRKLGAVVEEFANGLRITPMPLHGAEIETYDDHRMAMSLALVGLKIPGVTILNPGCVAKTYPDFWEDLAKFKG